ncbi:MAG: aminomethyl-transferring glycine dehydrogenase subunit GcvPA [Gammaproteobacteria bacterium]|nr:aminomethyl-transferring glycine dehydrogenase subunit GcvPA [Gammaproteobacteria bacterium]
MYHPHTKTDREEMLKSVGLQSLEELFSAVPKEFRYPNLDLPPRNSEMEIMDLLSDLAEGNETYRDLPMFLGAGAYHHYVPAAVDFILRRGEFYTAYTPYQPEISQGTLQAIFEFQSHVINLTGMEVSNASHYDGATAAAESINMARVVFRNKRKKAVISPAIHPQYRQTIDTYLQGEDFTVVGEDLDPALSPDALADLIDEDTAVVAVQYPDFFGRIYDLTALAEKAHEAGALLAVSVNPLALAIFKSPGEFDADIVSGEGQPLGIPLSFGGPYLGLLATKEKYVRSIAGRLVGETTDVNGKRGYVLTLSTREQHIKRERASSNICTNQGLMALAATVHISLLGKKGLKEVANLNYQKAHYAADQISRLDGYELWSDEVFFNEFVVKCPRPVEEVNDYLLEEGVIGGYDLGQDYPGMENLMLFAVTEMNSKEQIDYLINLLEEVAND